MAAVNLQLWTTLKGTTDKDRQQTNASTKPSTAELLSANASAGSYSKNIDEIEG